MDKEFSEKVTNYFKNVEIQLDSVTTELKLDRNIGGGVQAIKNE